MKAAKRGFIVVIQDTRRRFNSEGEWYPFKHESADGYDAVEWAAALPGYGITSVPVDAPWTRPATPKMLLQIAGKLTQRSATKKTAASQLWPPRRDSANSRLK